MKNPFSLLRSESIQHFLNDLANSKINEMKKVGESLEILQRKIQALEKNLASPGWIVEGEAEFETGFRTGPNAILRHGNTPFMDEEGCFWLKIHSGTSLPVTTSWGGEKKGYLFFHETYRHTLRWTGTSWEFAPWDSGSGFFAMSAIDLGAGWAECLGGSVSYLKSDGSVGSLTLPDYSVLGFMPYFLPISTLSRVTAIASAATLDTVVFKLFFRL